MFVVTLGTAASLAGVLLFRQTESEVPPMPRAIVMVTNAVAPDKLGGLERYVRELAAGLTARGRPVTVIAKDVEGDLPHSELGDDGVKIIRYTAPAKSDPFFALKYPFTIAAGIEEAIAASGHDSLLHCHYAIAGLSAAIRGRPFLHTFHAPAYREIQSERFGSYVLPEIFASAAARAAAAAEGFVLRRASSTVVLSEFMRGELALLAPGAASSATLVPGGVDTSFFSPGKADKPGGSPLLVTARRLTTRTGVINLVEAMPRVLAVLPNARLHVLGSGGAAAEIRALVDRLGLTEVVSLRGRVPEEDLLASYRAADLVVMPTLELEGFGLTTAEAMSCGTPVVGTPVGANPELIGLLSPSLLTRSSSPEDLADSVIAAYTSDSMQVWRRLARAVVHPRMSWENVCDEYEALYDKLAP